MDKWDLMLQDELKKQTIDLHQFVTRCCSGLQIAPQQVIDRLLSVDDEQDIINGLVSAESLRLHIKVWCEMDKPHYSGK